MWCKKNVRKRAQGMVRCQGFLFVGIDDRSEEVLVAQRLEQCSFIDDPTPSHVHYDRLPRKPGNLPLADHAFGFVSQRSVNGQDIRLLEKGIERINFLNAQSLETGFGDIRIVGENAHSECTGTRCYFASDPPEANDP